MSGRVGLQVEAMLRMPDTHAVVPMTVALSYSDKDPYAVTAAFCVGLGEPVEWTFGRDLLREGQRAHVGEGDVQVWPRPGGILGLGLRSPFGEAVLDLPMGKVRDFLRAAYRLVPEGGEAETAGAEIDRELLPGGALREGGRA